MVLADQVLGPLLFWAPAGSSLRLSGFASQFVLQLAIQAVGNYGPLNMLSAVLCLSLLDDKTLSQWLPTCFDQEDESGAVALHRRHGLQTYPQCATTESSAEERQGMVAAGQTAGGTGEAPVEDCQLLEPPLAKSAAPQDVETQVSMVSRAEVAAWCCLGTVALLCFGPPWGARLRMVQWQFNVLAEAVVTMG
eukprot:2002967-Amphidinium_carterae.1